MDKVINCIIIDDEPLAVKLLSDYAGKIQQLKVWYAGCDVYKAINVLKEQVIDLVFLDIQMPELTGIEVMTLFNDRHNFIITSAYQEYALDVYRFRVIDFLLKPVPFIRFKQSIEKFVNWQQAFNKKEVPDYLMVKADRKQHKILLDDILFIEGLKDYIKIHTTTEKIIVLENMKDIAGKLPGQSFLRVHRSYIVAVNSIKTIDGKELLLQNATPIPVGETYRKAVAEWLKTNKNY